MYDISIRHHEGCIALHLEFRQTGSGEDRQLILYVHSCLGWKLISYTVHSIGMYQNAKVNVDIKGIFSGYKCEEYYIMIIDTDNTRHSVTFQMIGESKPTESAGEYSLLQNPMLLN